MAENPGSLPVCVLRVDVQCCSKCSTRVKNRLQKINGVDFVDINTKKGLVIVSGFVDPSTLQRAITKIGKKAEVLVYEKDPIQAKNKLDQFTMQKNQNISDEENCCCCKDSKKDHKPVPKVPDQEPLSMHSQPYYSMGSNNAPPAWYGQRSFGPRFYCAGYPGLPPRYPIPMPRYPTPMAPYYYRGGPYGYGGYRPPIYSGLPLQPTLPPPPAPQPQIPLPNLHSVYSRQKDAPSGNALYHAFSDDNVQACSIM